MSRFFLTLLMSLLLAVSACVRGDNSGDDAAAEWGYEGNIGPDHWHQLSPAYSACGTGREQSPIELTSEITPTREPALEIDYRATPLVIVNNGHTVEVEYQDGGTLTVDGRTWEVLQFHFHAHSEHTVDGVASSLEMHIVHRGEDNERAVIGVLIDEGAYNPVLAAVFDRLPAEEGAPEEIDQIEINVAGLLPDDLAAWRYDGSLTTPPCSEGVRWHVLSTPVEASAQQIAAFQAIFDNNYRPVRGRVGPGPGEQ